MELIQSRLSLSCGEVALNTSHHIGLQWWMLVEQGAPMSYEHMMYMLFLGRQPTGVEADTRALIEWIEGGVKGTKSEGKRAFSIIQDYPRLWALFKAKYGIDIELEVIHWHKFLALFDLCVGGLGLDEVIRIRSYKPSKHDAREYQQSMKELQKTYALAEKKQKIKSEDDIHNQILAELRAGEIKGG